MDDENLLFNVVPEVAKYLHGWRCDFRDHRPKLLGPEGAYIITRLEKGGRIHFYAPSPRGPDDRYHSWQAWGISREAWSNHSVNCSADRKPRQIAQDLSRRLLAKVEIYWPLAMERKREELAKLEILQHVTNLFLKVLDGANILTWNSCHHRKNIGFDGGSCEVQVLNSKASFKFNDLSYSEALKIAVFYQQLKNEKNGNHVNHKEAD